MTLEEAKEMKSKLDMAAAQVTHIAKLLVADGFEVLATFGLGSGYCVVEDVFVLKLAATKIEKTEL